MRLVATLTTGYTVELACQPDLLATSTPDDLARLMDAEMPWVATSTGAVIRREAIIALHLEDDT